MNIRALFKVRVRGVITHRGRLLVVRHGPERNYYALPGGHLELGEDIKNCLKREVKEELGVVPKIGKLLYVHNFSQGGEQTIEFFFHILNGADFLKVDLSKSSHGSEIYELRWVSKTDRVRILPTPIFSDFKKGQLKKANPEFINFWVKSND